MTTFMKGLIETWEGGLTLRLGEAEAALAAGEALSFFAFVVV